ncbi:MAG: hypothetical protein ACFBQW_00190 [Sphingomonadaceae bacterium]
MRTGLSAAIILALGTCGATMGVHLGRSSIAQIDPVYTDGSALARLERRARAKLARKEPPAETARPLPEPVTFESAVREEGYRDYVEYEEAVYGPQERSTASPEPRPIRAEPSAAVVAGPEPELAALAYDPPPRRAARPLRSAHPDDIYAADGRRDYAAEYARDMREGRRDREFVVIERYAAAPGRHVEIVEYVPAAEDRYED